MIKLNYNQWQDVSKELTDVKKNVMQTIEEQQAKLEVLNSFSGPEFERKVNQLIEKVKSDGIKNVELRYFCAYSDYISVALNYDKPDSNLAYNSFAHDSNMLSVTGNEASHYLVYEVTMDNGVVLRAGITTENVSDEDFNFLCGCGKIQFNQGAKLDNYYSSAC